MWILAHTDEMQHGWHWLIEPWELHPILIHFPIAFLIGGAFVDLAGRLRRSPGLTQAATAMFVAGLVTGLLAGAAGLLAYFTVPGHTEQAHTLMYWHLAVQVLALLLFAWPTWQRWHSWSLPPPASGLIVIWLAVIALIVGSAIGGFIIYHGGAGVEPDLLTPELREHEH